MHLQKDITSFDKKGQDAVTKLFGHLQDAHNHMAQVAKAVIDLSKVSSPDQFTFVLQLAVRPIIQLKIPPHLLAPTELRFDKERLTPEEITEKNCCNLIFPRPFHPKLSSIAFKHPTRCLAAAAHFLIRKKLFNSKYPQPLVAKNFAVAEKNSILLSVKENTIQERKHLRENVPQMLKQQIPNHQLHRISHKTSQSLNNSHKMSPSLNNSHKVCPPLNNNHKVQQALILNRNLSRPNSATMMMMKFQTYFPQHQKLLRRKILDLHQRNRNIV